MTGMTTILENGLRRGLRWLAAGAVCLSMGALRLVADMAADLAAVSVEAAGGWPAHAALRSFRATGVTKVGETEVPFILHAARPSSVRIETLGEKGSLVRAYDGVHAPWKKSSPLEPPRRLSRAEERDFILDADFDQPLYNYEARKISLDYAGEEASGGHVYQKILATIRFTDLVMLFIDAETHLVARRDLVKRGPADKTVVRTFYGDYRPVAGVLLPHVIRTEVRGEVVHETRIEAYDANPSLPEDFFSPPVADWPKL